METVKLPTEKAHEPDEGARQPSCDTTMSSQEESRKPKKQRTTFADDVLSTEKEPSQTSSSYKEALSQPAPGLPHRSRLAWLQRRRTGGLWAQCDACERWRHLPAVAEPPQLPARWYCSMNPDKAMADCSVPEAPLRMMEEEDLIHSEYSAGSLVWARLAGWPWWPAMVDDCPDTEQFYWLDGFSDIPTHYNVVFFDSTDTTRAWISPENLKPYTPNKTRFRNLSVAKKYQKRLEKAQQQADKAEKLPVLDRLAKFSFISTYKGAIVSPKKISKQEIEKFQKKLYRKFNVEFPTEETSDPEESEDESARAFRAKNKKNNVILIGTPKSNKIKRRLISDNDKDTDRNCIRNIQNGEVVDDEIPKQKTMKKNCDGEAKKQPKHSANADCARNTINSDEIFEQPSAAAVSSDTFKQPNSMTIQIGSIPTQNFESEVSGIDNDSSKTYLPELPEGSDPGVVSQDFRIRAETPSSDDFDF